MISRSQIFLVAALVLWCPLKPDYANAQTIADYETARALVQRGEFERAFPLLRQILEQSPEDLKARSLMGIALSATGRRDEASEQFRKVLAQDPKFVPALKNLAVNELALGRSQEAKLHFEEALSLAPHDATCHWGLAELAYAARDFSQAVSHYEQSGDLALKDPRVTIRFASSYLEVSETEKAATNLTSEVAKVPAEKQVEAQREAKAMALLEKIPLNAGAAVQFQTGLLLARIEQFAAAARRFELARNGFPDPYQVQYNLMLMLIKQRDYVAAIRMGEEMVAAGSRKAELYNLLAQAYDKSGKKKEAYERLREATTLEPQDETNYLDLITLLMQYQNYDFSLEIADIGLQRIPQSNRLHLQRGGVLAMKGQYEAAVKEFQISSKLSPEASLPQVALGLLLMQTGKTSESIEVLRRQSARTPNNAQVFWFLAEALNQSGAASGSEAEAEEIGALEKSIRLDPGLSQARALLGKILLRRGDVARATVQLEAAVEIDPEDLTATYLLARALQRKGDAARAKQLFAKVGKAKTDDVQFTQRNLLRLMKAGPQ